MRINSRRWRASVLLVLAIVMGTSAFSALQPLPSPETLAGSAGVSFEARVTPASSATSEASIVGLPGTELLSFAGDQHFDVEDSRSNWQPAVAGSGLIPPTEQLTGAGFSGVQPSHRLGGAASILSLSARARN